MSEKIRMAIIDDERHITDHVRRIIEERFVGLFEIMVSSDAETVVEALKRYEIPIIISDIRMPKMNGIDFMKYVHENYPSTKFLLLSAYPNFEYVYEANRYGVKYLLKVEDDSVILQTIADMLSTNRRAEDAEETGANDRLMQFLTEYIDKHYNTDLSLETLAQIVHFNPSYLSRIFKQFAGENIFEYVKRVRMRESKTLLEETDFKVAEISEMVGYKSANYFCYVFKTSCGCSPQAYRRSSVLNRKK